MQGCTQEGLDPLRKNMNRSKNTAQIFLEGVQTLLCPNVMDIIFKSPESSQM